MYGAHKCTYLEFYHKFACQLSGMLFPSLRLQQHQLNFSLPEAMDPQNDVQAHWYMSCGLTYIYIYIHIYIYTYIYIYMYKYVY